MVNDTNTKQPELSSVVAKGIGVASSMFAGAIAATVVSSRSPGETIVISVVMLLIWAAVASKVKAYVATLYAKRPVTSSTYTDLLDFVTLTFVFFIFQVATVVVKVAWAEGELNWKETAVIVICVMLVGFSAYKKILARIEPPK